jgi:uncharacterized protein (TIGR04255 family)
MPWVFDDPNPVTKFIISMEMRDLIASDILRQISEIHRRFRQELPRKIEQQMLTLPFPPQPFGGLAPPQINAPQQLGGLVFDFVGPIGTTLRALNIIQNRIIYMTTQYNRWEETWPLARRLLSECGRIIMTSNPTKGLLLEYQSAYYWNGENNNFSLVDFIRPNSDLLPSSFIDRTAAAHSFNGWTERPNDEPVGTRVDNINVSIAETPDQPGEAQTVRWRAHIAVQHRLIFDAPIGDSQRFFGDDADAVLSACANRMHELNKNLVRRVLADTMIARIPGLAN